MAFHHRKLLNDSLEDSVEKFCEPYYCNPAKNLEGSCPIACISRCYPICNHPPLYDLPPPPPDYAALLDNDHRSKPSGLSVFLTVSLAVLATTFLLFSCYTIYKFCKGRYRSSRRQSAASQRHQEEEEGREDFLDEVHGPVVDHPIWYIRTIGLQPSVINAITICKYKRGDGLVEGTECSVCLNEFHEDETLRLLPKCNHAFHIPCIDTWLRSHTNCPNCRAGIVISMTNFQAPAQSHQSSGLLEEPQVGVSEHNRQSEGERESQVLEVSTEVEDEDESKRNENGNLMEEVGNSGAREAEGIQPRRRSVSMDALSASMVSAAIANAFPVQFDRSSGKGLLETNGSNMGIAPKEAGNVQSSSKLEGSSSMEKPLQKGTSLVGRSLSCSAKVFLSRYSRSRNSILPL